MESDGRFESASELKMQYAALFAGEVSYKQQGEGSSEDELLYLVESEGIPLAEVTLKAAGEVVTELAVFSMRDWEVAEIKPLFEKIVT